VDAAVPAGLEAPPLAPRALRFDRHELSGAFGDLGTTLPLLVGMILAAGLDAASVLIVFGALQVGTALVYRMPMPVQPLKAVAAIVIAQHVPAAVLHGGGLAIGLVMLALSVTGLVGWLARVIPKAVVRGVQAGLGVQLASLALREYVPTGGGSGYLLAAAAFAVTVALLNNRRVPPAPVVLALGAAYALATTADPDAVWRGAGLRLPTLHAPSWAAMVQGFVLLALPQVPLSLGNSVLATRQLAADLFPDRSPPPVRKIGLTYAAMNLTSAALGGVPACHGSGGMAGHYAFGGRTGGSVIISGAFYLLLGLLFGGSFAAVSLVFPRPVLGVLLVVEGLALLVLVRDLADAPSELALAFLVALVAATLPYGYLVGMVLGVALMPLARRGRLRLGR
jgi:MFS superfamily sulfate permease-like transporter